MKISIRLARKSDLLQYTKLLQNTYQDTYKNEAIGLTKECFSKEVFNSLIAQRYLESNLEINEKQKCWLAFLDSRLVGSITITEREDNYELKGFYVATEYQGKGIGKKLFKLVLGFAKNKDIILDIYAHNTKTIEIYKKWGFKKDAKKGEFYRHWPQWPKGLKVKCFYMRYEV